MKSSRFVGLLALFILSGCSTLNVQPGDIVISPAREHSLEQLIGRAGNSSLTEKDRIDIVAGIKTIHTDGSIPDTWKSQNGESILITNQGFTEVGDAYCVKAKIDVDGKEFIPFTQFCYQSGEWTVSTKKAEPIHTPIVLPVVSEKAIPLEKVEMPPVMTEERAVVVPSVVLEKKPETVLPIQEKINPQVLKDVILQPSAISVPDPVKHVQPVRKVQSHRAIKFTELR